MINPKLLMCLYTRVLEDTSFVNKVSDKDVAQAIDQMHRVYQGSPDSLDKSFHLLTDFNEVAYRCAYLFKYAPFHTALTYRAMSHALTENPYEFRVLLDSLSGPLKLCSLGGGPGADLMGVLAALHNQFGFFRSTVKLVDIMSEWELTFWSILDELRHGNYWPLSESMSEKWFDWSFMTADLQNKMSNELVEVLGTADMVTMIKFVSAAASKETSKMIEKIFCIMKPGAFVLFVDNAAGGFKEMISSAARKYEFNDVSTPLKHQTFTSEGFKNFKYGYKSCYESKVAVQLLMKSYPANYYSNKSNLLTNWPCNENIPLSPVSHWQKIEVPQFKKFRIGPKPVDFTNETFESPSISRGINLPLSSRLNRFKAQNVSPVNLNESFESRAFWGSTPHASKTTAGHDSGYSDESFESELSVNSPVYNSSPYFRPSKGMFRSRIPMEKTRLSFPENESFLNTPQNNAPHHSASLENSLSPIPYRRNLQQPESPKISFKGNVNSGYNQILLNSESQFHRPSTSNRHPFGILQNSGRYQPKRSQITLSKTSFVSLSASQQCPGKYEAPRSRTVLMSHPKPYKQSSSHSWPPSHQSPRNYKAPRPRTVLINRHNPYQRKRSRTQ